MVKRRAEITINRSADDIWATIGDFGDISWIPHTEQCTLDGNDRTVSKQAWNFVLVQRLTEHDDTNRTYSYALPQEIDFESMRGPGAVLRFLDGTITVTPAGATRADITWDVDTEDFLIDGVHAEYQNALETLKANLEGPAVAER